MSPINRQSKGQSVFYAPLHELLIELARRETRSATVNNDPALPDGAYGLIEAYCNERGCDCRRVLSIFCLGNECLQNGRRFQFLRPLPPRPPLHIHCHTTLTLASPSPPTAAATAA
ncbi:MAG: hypothetical protein KC441_04295 [Anaerolineales bacterium]|nr:hypothetical protein [Anaerolineales bacterium]